MKTYFIALLAAITAGSAAAQFYYSIGSRMATTNRSKRGRVEFTPSCGTIPREVYRIEEGEFWHRGESDDYPTGPYQYEGYTMYRTGYSSGGASESCSLFSAPPHDSCFYIITNNILIAGNSRCAPCDDGRIGTQRKDQAI